jgi:hypothetical protein
MRLDSKPSVSFFGHVETLEDPRLDRCKLHRQRRQAEQQSPRHGRVETRCDDVVPVPTTLRHRDDWIDLRSICRVTQVWTERGEKRSEVRYFLSSLPGRAVRLQPGNEKAPGSTSCGLPGANPPSQTGPYQRRP